MAKNQTSTGKLGDKKKVSKNEVAIKKCLQIKIERVGKYPHQKGALNKQAIQVVSADAHPSADKGISLLNQYQKKERFLMN
jgi:hypothetical protein